jgi:hypothetical protein
MKIIRLMIVATLLTISANVQAASNISGVTGTFSNGQTITVSGSGFGATGPTVRFFDDFEKGTVGSVIGQNNAEIGSYSPLSSNSRVTYTNLYSVSGSKAFISDQSVSSTNKMVVEVPGSDSDLFVSWWEVIPAGDPMPGADNVDGTNWKMVWFVRGDVDAQPGMSDLVVAVLLNTGGDSINVSSNSGVGQGWVPGTASPNNWQQGRWTRMWAYVKSSNTGTGAFDFWFLHMGQTPSHAMNKTNVNTLASGAAGPYNRIDFPGYTRTSASRPIYDDIYIASGAGARARVEIGDNANYTQCKSLHVLPVTSWSDSSIQALVNSGNFKAGQTAYLFVIDASGNISSGKQIQIGAQSQSFPTPLNLRKTN